MINLAEIPHIEEWISDNYCILIVDYSDIIEFKEDSNMYTKCFLMGVITDKKYGDFKFYDAITNTKNEYTGNRWGCDTGGIKYALLIIE